MQHLIRIITLWRRRVEARRALGQIDFRTLREAGIDPGFADYEMAQPFWRPLLPLRDPPPKTPAPAANDCTPLARARPARVAASSLM